MTKVAAAPAAYVHARARAGLVAVMEARQRIIVCGAPATGKATLLRNRLLNETSPPQRVGRS